jgi:hypothetical protein
MVDARIPERWLNDRRILLLSDDEYRTYFTALVWAVANRTDGAITHDDLALMPRISAQAAQQAAHRFADLGLWAPDSQGWLIEDFADTQTSRGELEVLENNRRRDREKKQRQRSASKEEAPSSSPGTVPGDVPRDVSPGHHRQAGQAGKAGQDKSNPTAKAKPLAQAVRSFSPAESDSWEAIEAGGSDWSVTPIPQAKIDPTCVVCGVRLENAESIRRGVCAKPDEQHRAASRQRRAS